jgi:hypothetical protein
MSQISARGDAKSDAARQHWLSERIRLVRRTDCPSQADVLRRMAALPRANDPPG